MQYTAQRLSLTLFPSDVQFVEQQIIEQQLIVNHHQKKLPNVQFVIHLPIYGAV